MKDFKQDKKGKFICEECKEKFDDKKSLFIHVCITHNTIRSYLEKYIFDASTGVYDASVGAQQKM
jgi:hypothetical protein